jgi:hypothetical protein
MHDSGARYPPVSTAPICYHPGCRLYMNEQAVAPAPCASVLLRKRTCNPQLSLSTRAAGPPATDDSAARRTSSTSAGSASSPRSRTPASRRAAWRRRRPRAAPPTATRAGSPSRCASGRRGTFALADCTRFFQNVAMLEPQLHAGKVVVGLSARLVRKASLARERAAPWPACA